MHKTGSSSIQAALKGYDDGSTVYASLRAVNHSIPFYSAFSSNHLDYPVFQIQGFSIEQIKAMRVRDRSDIERTLKTSQRERVIFSGEDISQLSREDTEEMLYFLEQYAKNILVIGYFRDPIGFARSELQQLIQGGAADGTLFLKPNYRNRFEKFISLLGRDRVVLRHFHKDALIGGDVIDDFVATCGLDSQKVSPTRQNESLSLEAQRCIFALNRSNRLTTGDSRAFWARQRFIAVVRSLLSGPEKVPDKYLSDCIDLADLAWLKSVTAIDFSADAASVEAGSADLVDFLTQVDQETVKTLDVFLRKSGVSHNYGDDLISLVNRLYYMCFYCHYFSTPKVFLNRTLPESASEKLQKIAMKYEAGEQIDKNDALYLMKLAWQAKPSNRLARQKMEEWSKKGAP